MIDDELNALKGSIFYFIMDSTLKSGVPAILVHMENDEMVADCILDEELKRRALESVKAQP